MSAQSGKVNLIIVIYFENFTYLGQLVSIFPLVVCTLLAELIYNLPPPTHLASSRNSTKDLQNKDQISSLGFPTPPPAVADASVFTEQAPDEYLSLQVQRRDSNSSSCLKDSCLYILT